MATFIKTLSDIVALLLQALRLSVLLPALLLVGMNIALVVPVLEQTKLRSWIDQVTASGSGPIFVISAIILIAYTFGVLNIPIIRMFEGFPFQGFLDFMRLHHQRRIVFLQRKIDELMQEAQTAAEQARNAQTAAAKSDAEIRTRQAEGQANQFRDELIWMYPHHQTWRALPFRLGNVIAAAEEFPDFLYGFDAITFWPYLNPILSEEGYATFVEREKAILDFMLNCAIVALLLGGELFYVDLIANHLTAFSLFKLVTGGVFAYGAYVIATQAALSWGYTIRVACVMYKDKLRQRLGLVPPKGFYQERLLWQDTAAFFRDHGFARADTIFQYKQPQVKKPRPSS